MCTSQDLEKAHKALSLNGDTSSYYNQNLRLLSASSRKPTLWTIQRAVIPSYVPSDMRGTAYGFYYLITGLSFFVCNIMFGFLWDQFSFDTAAFYSLTLSLSAIVGMFLFIRRYVSLSQ